MIRYPDATLVVKTRGGKDALMSLIVGNRCFPYCQPENMQAVMWGPTEAEFQCNKCGMRHRAPVMESDDPAAPVPVNPRD